MIKVFKYLKSSFLSILLIIGLLFFQAYLDLTLPDYTSKIINVGVQQNGIENSAIDKISEDSLNKLVLFLDNKDSKYIMNQYKYSYDYKGKKIYKLKSDTSIDKVSSILSKPMMLTYYIDNSKDNKKSNIKFDVDGGSSLYTMMGNMDYNSRMKMVLSFNSKIKDIPDTMIEQASINFIKNEYKSIGVNLDRIQTNYIIKIGLIMLAIAFGALVDGVLIVLIGSRMAAKLSKTLREKVFRKVVGFSKSEIKQYGQSSLITRTTNDIQQIQMVIVFLLRVVFYAPIIGIGGVMKALNTNSSMTYIIGVAVCSILAVVLTLFIIAMPKFTKIQKLIDKLNLVTREILSGLPVIRAFSNEDHEQKRFDDANKRLTRVNIFVNRTMSFMMPIMMLIMNLVSLALVYKGAYGVNDGTMQVGDILAYIQYTMQIIMAFLMISMMSIMLPRANVSAKRVMEVIDTKTSITNPDNPVLLDKSKNGVVEFRNVSFRYPDADYDVISDISFTANPGEVTAFIGSTGSGKSTLINLIPRFYDATDGEILIDDVNIKNLDLFSLRDTIGFIPQKGVLFTGTIKDNIRYGNKKVKDKDIKKAIDISQSLEFVSKLPGEDDYMISQGGTNVSGGQKQRLSIARAIAKNPDIYIFDDSFSALDFKTDAKLRSELSKITKDKTVLIVAQRISTIMNADKIVVLDEGKIVGIGKHKDLMKNCNIYKEIALSQLSKEELNNA